MPAGIKQPRSLIQPHFTRAKRSSAIPKRSSALPNRSSALPNRSSDAPKGSSRAQLERFPFLPTLTHQHLTTKNRKIFIKLELCPFGSFLGIVPPHPTHRIRKNRRPMLGA